jgi:hypothetical protein
MEKTRRHGGRERHRALKDACQRWSVPSLVNAAAAQTPQSGAKDEQDARQAGARTAEAEPTAELVGNEKKRVLGQATNEQSRHVICRAVGCVGREKSLF